MELTSVKYETLEAAQFGTKNAYARTEEIVHVWQTGTYLLTIWFRRDSDHLHTYYWSSAGTLCLVRKDEFVSNGPSLAVSSLKSSPEDGFVLHVENNHHWSGSSRRETVDLRFTALEIEVRKVYWEYKIHVNRKREVFTFKWLNGRPLFRQAALSGVTIALDRNENILRFNHLGFNETFLKSCTDPFQRFLPRFGLTLVSSVRGQDYPIPAGPPHNLNGLPVTVESPPPE